MCRYECEESDSSEEEEGSKIPKKYEIVCVFDFYNTPLKEVIDEWLRKLLRMCGDDEERQQSWHSAPGRSPGEELKNKWRQKINEVILTL